MSEPLWLKVGQRFMASLGANSFLLLHQLTRGDLSDGDAVHLLTVIAAPGLGTPV
jgi:hypothetical protein